MDADSYPRLFSPLRLGRLELANRFVVPALTTNFGDLGGQVTDEVCGYLGRRGAGGFGLVVCENFGVQAGAKALPRMLMAHEDRYIPGMARLAAAVKQGGAPVLAQINHPGRQTKSKFTGHELVAPSAIPCPINREMPRALDLDEIPDTVRKDLVIVFLKHMDQVLDRALFKRSRNGGNGRHARKNGQAAEPRRRSPASKRH